MRAKLPTIDWSDMDAVIAFAQRLGTGMCVIKLPMRDNYNIVHASNLGRYADAAVIHFT